MKILLAIFFFTIVSFNCNGQENVPIKISFKYYFGDSVLKDGVYYKINNNDSILIEVCKFYVSNIILLHNKTEFVTNVSPKLIDAFDEKRQDITFKIPQSIKFDNMQFSLGIDSLTNTSGALGGDLDPTKGMYWTWQSGYINFKLEGKSNLCNTRNNEFTFHLGGYQYPYSNFKTIKKSMVNKSNIDVCIDLKNLFLEINLSTQNHIMSPRKEANLITDKIATVIEAGKK